MDQRHTPNDPEPYEPAPAGRLLVPVRPGPLGHTPRFFRTPLGARTAVAFTTERRLVTALGPAQPWIALAEPALRALAEPLGIDRLTVDPALVAPAPRPLTARRTPDRTTPAATPRERRAPTTEPRPWAPAAAAPRPGRAPSR
ncbi:SAV_915 family protein [Kitasatospora nipponensis]